MRVLVLDGNQNQAVAAVRSLARAGHQVVVGESTPWSKAGWSRHSSGSFPYPAPQSQTEGFLDRIIDVARAEPDTLVLPMTEATTLPLSANRERLYAVGAKMVLPTHAELLRAFDKEATTNLAASLGVPVPLSTVISNFEEATRTAQEIAYPVVLKPRSSEELSTVGKVRSTGRPRYARNEREFHAAYEDLSRRAAAIMVQQYVAGEGAGYFALMNHGELRAEFAHRRIRDVYPTGSGSAVRVSVPPPPQIREASLTILKALNWHGVAMVEFRHVEGEAPVFLEVNGRFWHSLALARYSGVDFPALLARMAEQSDIEPVNGYLVGVRCRWFLGDLRHLVEVWRGAPMGYPGTYPGRFSTLAAVLTPVPGTFHDLFTWDDPLPELGDWINFSRRIFTQRSAERSADPATRGSDGQIRLE
jgi:predicted ATP-grasp superfamily ATP-dependent carboligase